MPWGHPGEHHDFEPQRHDDGYLEVIGFTMTSLVSGPGSALSAALAHSAWEHDLKLKEVTDTSLCWPPHLPSLAQGLLPRLRTHLNCLCLLPLSLPYPPFCTLSGVTLTFTLWKEQILLPYST
jgi:hypothetical protein